MAPKSLRTILIISFFLFSVVPLAFVTWYSVNKYEKAIDNELSQRLSGNAREISSILAELQTGLQQKRDRYLKDNSLLYHLSTNDGAALKSLGTQWLKSDFSTGLNFFSKEGRLLASVFKDENGEIKELVSTAKGSVYLSDQNIQKIQTLPTYDLVDFSSEHKLTLISFVRVFGKGNRFVGYLEQLIELDGMFAERLKNRLKLELVFLRANGQVNLASHSDFYLYKKGFFESYMRPFNNSFFDLNLRGTPYGFIMYPLKWGQTDFFLALGASKVEAKAVLKNVNYAFYSVVGVVILLLLVTIILASNYILKPLNDLLSAIQIVQSSDRPIEIPIKNETEIGQLTEAFNDMSRNVIKAREDLKKKITELEAANLELKETQSRLVHSSKMVSLGQLVAGVAHELNNPISFIYSNVSHLKEYSEKLIFMAEMAEKDPKQIPDLKKQLEIEYIKADLPKLISSCEEGARRTRDIVLGLRNFSRLEEAVLKEIDIHQSIDNTIQLLIGEIKNRVDIRRNYGSLPLVSCYASQINQVFMNILSNAVQAIEGNGSIWITTELVKMGPGKDYVKIAFQDSGKGMTAQVMEKVFDPFFSTKGVGQGTGLGLSISYGIIENHGGHIDVKSEVGIGTEFTVIIPVRAQPKDGNKIAQV